MNDLSSCCVSACGLWMFIRVCAPQVRENTPESVFELLEYVKLLLLYVQECVLVPALQYVTAALQSTWRSLQESCE